MNRTFNLVTIAGRLARQEARPARDLRADDRRLGFVPPMLARVSVADDGRARLFVKMPGDKAWRLHGVHLSEYAARSAAEQEVQ